MSAKVAVVGGGPAGMMAAGRAAELGAEAVLLEKNDRPGRKLLITGKGRCNLTNAGDINDFITNIHNGSFLYSALAAFDHNSLIDFFGQRGLATKVERGRRVFPESDRARDVVDVLVNYIKRAGVRLCSGDPVDEVVLENGRVGGVRLRSGETVPATAVILATGGVSYPATGSTGDGFKIAATLGHNITQLRPSLVPLETSEPWVVDLSGLSLRNVLVRVREKNRVLAEEFGEMLFTHFGVSGPAILTLSRVVVDRLPAVGKLTLDINLKPALTPEQLDRRVQRDFQAETRRQFKNSLSGLLPKAMIPVVMEVSGIPPEKQINQISRSERQKLVELLQHFSVTVTGTRPIEEAIVTAGGVSIREIDPQSMESRLVPGLYFAGELIDIDGKTGGYNLQAAFSTGYVAGTAAAGNPVC